MAGGVGSAAQLCQNPHFGNSFGFPLGLQGDCCSSSHHVLILGTKGREWAYKLYCSLLKEKKGFLRILTCVTWTPQLQGFLFSCAHHNSKQNQSSSSKGEGTGSGYFVASCSSYLLLGNKQLETVHTTTTSLYAQGFCGSECGQGTARMTCLLPDVWGLSWEDN